MSQISSNEQSPLLGASSSFRPIQQGIVWKDVSFHLKDSLLKKLTSKLSFGLYKYQQPQPLLDKVNGNVRLGELTALMGPSGAGKSTLLKCLTKGVCFEGFSGDILPFGINEKIRASIIHQDEGEHLIPELTVMQTLIYASQLKNKKLFVKKNFHETLVNTLLRKLALANKAEETVENCSGGEKKRLAIGVELVEEAKPHILFLDEPTTGLDSNVAFTVVESLRTFVEEGMAIVATIHQPSKEILNCFHKAIVLSGQGAVVYHGNPNDLSMEMFFTRVIPKENLAEYKRFENKADVLIGIASSLKRNQRVQENRAGQVPFFETEAVKNVCRRMIQETEETYQREAVVCANQGEDNYNYVQLYSGLLCRTTYPVISYFSLYSFWTLLLRTVKLKLILGKKGLLLRLFIYLLVVFTTTHLYDRSIGQDDGCRNIDDRSVIDPMNCPCNERVAEIQGEEANMSNIKLIFFFLLFLSLESLLNVTLTFPTEFKLFLREFENGHYSPLAYFLVKVLVEIPAQLVIPTIYTIYFYTYTQQPDFDIKAWTFFEGGLEGHRFKTFLRATYLSGFIAQGIGFFIGKLCVASITKAILLSSGTLLGLAFFSGFFKKKMTMSYTQDILSRCSFLRYGLDMALVSVYGGGRCDAPQHPYALIAFGIHEGEVWGNWRGFLVIIAVTWRMTLLLLMLKASKWYAFKVLKASLHKCLEPSMEPIPDLEASRLTESEESFEGFNHFVDIQNNSSREVDINAVAIIRESQPCLNCFNNFCGKVKYCWEKNALGYVVLVAVYFVSIYIFIANLVGNWSDINPINWVF